MSHIGGGSFDGDGVVMMLLERVYLVKNTRFDRHDAEV